MTVLPALMSAPAVRTTTGMLARPLLGGGPVLLDGGPVPVATPCPGPPQPVEAIDVTVLLLLTVAVFAFIGFWHGFDRAWRTASLAIPALVVIDAFWPFMARWGNHFHKLFVFSIVKKGMFADDPTAAWEAVGSLPALIPVHCPAPAWQVAFFTSAVLVAFLVAEIIAGPPTGDNRHRTRLAVLVRRALGVAADAGNGFGIGWIYLAHLFPNSHALGFPLGATADRLSARVGPLAGASMVVVGLVLGVMLLGPRYKKVYD